MRRVRSARSNAIARSCVPKCSISSSSSARHSAASSSGAPPGGRRRCSRTNDSPVRLGLIAGNGQFPFLVLDAARSVGHDVTVVAIKEEAFPDLAEAAARAPRAALHWVSLGQLGKCISLLKEAGDHQDLKAGAAAAA